MTKGLTKKRNYFIILLASVLVVILAVLIGVRESSKVTIRPTPTPQGGNLKEYKSDILDFTVRVPNNFSVQEKSSSVEIISSGGSLYVDRNGTNFENLKDYINDLDRRNNKSKISVERSLIIDGYEGQVRLINGDSGDFQKEYMIFVDGIVYVIFTNKEPLFNDLDQIAQSFRYTP